jgi:hypothetical protein
MGMWDRPPRREAQGDGAAVVLRARESRVHGEGRQVSRNPTGEVREMRNAATILGIKRHWRAEYSERRKLGSEGDGGKSTHQATRPPSTLLHHLTPGPRGH